MKDSILIYQTYTILEIDGRRISRIKMYRQTPFVDATETKNESENNEQQ